MYSSINIENYRNIQKADIKSLNKVNLFIGPNNSGKTSLLEAVYLLSSPLNFQACMVVMGHRANGLQVTHKSLISNLSWLFSRQNISIPIKLTGEIEKKKYQVSLSSHKYTQITDAGIRATNSQDLTIGKLIMQFVISDINESFTKEIDFSSAQRLSMLGSDAPPLQIAGLINSHWHSQPDVGIREFSTAEKNGLFPLCLQLMQEFDKEITDIKIILDEDDQPVIHFKSEELGLYPISIVGDGYKRVLLTTLTLASVINGCLMVDEFDAGIHHSMLKRYFEWLIKIADKYNIQLYLSSHSFDALSVLTELDAAYLASINIYKILKSAEQTDFMCIKGQDAASAINELGVDLR